MMQKLIAGTFALNEKKMRNARNCYQRSIVLSI